MKIFIDTFFGPTKHIVALVEHLPTENTYNHLEVYKIIKHIRGDLHKIFYFSNYKQYTELRYSEEYNEIYIDSDIVNDYIFDLTNEHKLEYL